MPNIIKTITLTGKDEADLNEKQWDWQTGSRHNVVILEQHPDEILPSAMSARPGFAKIKAVDRVSRRIDYVKRNQ
jgi:hypothetical protein